MKKKRAKDSQSDALYDLESIVMKSKGIDLEAHEQDQFLLADQKTQLNKSGNRTCPGMEHIHYDQTPILDTIRNNCPDVSKQRASQVSKEKLKWIRRAGSKALTVHLSSKLRNHVKDQLNTCQRHRKDDWLPWSKRYARSMFCCDIVEQTGSKLQTTFCRSKWCTVCGRNRSAKITDAYGDVLIGLPDLYNVVLTIRNMEADKLALALDRMNSTWRKIYNAMTRKGIKPQGARTLEITYGVKGYHPHYHILISGLENAMMLQSLWMKHFKNEAGQGGQYVSPVDLSKGIGSVMELVKYSVKPMVNGEMLPPDVLHTINVATFKRQMFSPFGIKKVKPQEIQPPEIEVSKADWIAPNTTVYHWDQYHREWRNKTGSQLVKWSNKEVDEMIRVAKNRKKTVKKQ